MKVLKHTLKIYHTYRISNAVINNTPAQHQVIDNDYQWVLYARTQIEEVKVKPLSIKTLKYNFVPLANLAKYTKSREGIGINLTNHQPSVYFWFRLEQFDISATKKMQMQYSLFSKLALLKKPRRHGSKISSSLIKGNI